MAFCRKGCRGTDPHRKRQHDTTALCTRCSRRHRRLTSSCYIWNSFSKFIRSWGIVVKYTYRFTKRFSALHENKGFLREEASVVCVFLDPSRNDSSSHQKENKTGAQFDVTEDINFTLLDLMKKMGTVKVQFYLVLKDSW